MHPQPKQGDLNAVKQQYQLLPPENFREQYHLDQMINQQQYFE
jgi:hypothetical protein